MNFIKKLKKNPYKRWAIVPSFVFLLLLFPISFILYHVFTPTSENFIHFSKLLLLEYLANTLELMALVFLFSFLFSFPQAYILSHYNFKLTRVFKHILILPIAIPTYIVAISYTNIFDIGGVLSPLAIAITGKAIGSYSLFSILPLSIILASVLYPYLFINLYTYFSSNASIYHSSAASLGAGKYKYITKVLFPISIPALINGFLLIAMELINDYGAVKLFGVNTITLGIFKTWFGYYDIDAALKMSAILLMFVLTITLIEKYFRNIYQDSKQSKNDYQYKSKLNPIGNILAFLICVIPFCIGFVFPIWQLITDALITYPETAPMMSDLVLNTVKLAIPVALISIICSIFMINAEQIISSKFMRLLNRFSTIGYAIPGAIIALAIMSGQKLFNLSFSDNIPLALLVLSYAYFLRFLSVPYSPLDSNFSTINQLYDKNARTLGRSNMEILFRIKIPLSYKAIFFSFFLIFVDIIKELPLTMILRPFNFDTLSSKVFQYASDEMIAKSSLPALLIVALGILPLLFLRKLNK